MVVVQGKCQSDFGVCLLCRVGVSQRWVKGRKTYSSMLVRSLLGRKIWKNEFKISLILILILAFMEVFGGI